MLMYNENINFTPQDILDKDFNVDTRGYRPQEVDKFLDLVIKDYTEFNTNVFKTLGDALHACAREENEFLSNISVLALAISNLVLM